LITVPEPELELDIKLCILSPSFNIFFINILNKFVVIYKLFLCKIAYLGICKKANKFQKNKGLPNNVNFFLADIKRKLKIKPIYDLVFTERMLINLDSWASQKKSIIKLVNCLKPKGTMVLMENSATGLKKINDYRSMLNLKKIKAPWHNLYLDDNKMLNFKIKNCKLTEVISYSSTYYFLSRVVNAWLANQRGIKPNYNAKINKLAIKLPSISDCAQGKIYLYKKIS